MRRSDHGCIAAVVRQAKCWAVVTLGSGAQRLWIQPVVWPCLDPLHRFMPAWSFLMGSYVCKELFEVFWCAVASRSSLNAHEKSTHLSAAFY
ncbi:hypothetical protein [Synechococcus sp. MIT S1220]|uniref:hypothetical protein n=1 Tax=Synechococcus sp. MIT S1220 TaxID=3082549 RepID=UPI0039B0EBFF